MWLFYRVNLKSSFKKNNHLHFMTKSHPEPAIIQDSLIYRSSFSLLGLWLHLCLAYCLRSVATWICVFKEIYNVSIFICGFALHNRILFQTIQFWCLLHFHSQWDPIISDLPWDWLLIEGCYSYSIQMLLRFCNKLCCLLLQSYFALHLRVVD